MPLAARALLATALVVGAMVGCGASPLPSPEEALSVESPKVGPPVQEAPVEVPDVTGEDAESASSTLEADGFGVVLEPEGVPSLCTVEDQEPIGEAEPDVEVTLSLACEVPDVTGKNVEDAATNLEDAGYSAKVRPKVDDTALCSVEEQDPTGEVELGETIVLRHDCVEVPEVVGMDADSARGDIGSSGDLTATLDPDPADTTDCTVWSQDLEGTVNKGEDVLLTLDCPGGDYGY